MKIGLLGLGTVGTGVTKILLDPAQRHPLLKDIEIARIGVRSPDKPRRFSIDAAKLTSDLESIVTDPDVDLVVEVLGGLEPARSLILKAIGTGKHVVTANKAVVARYGHEIFSAANQAGVYVLLEAAVGGGIPVIAPLKQALGVNRLRGVTGIVNGTTNYILTRMQNEGGDFEAILQDAQRLGYAEADPTADVDGYDAADKLAILASLAFGGRIHLEEIHREGIRNVSATDISYARTLGFVIKLLAVARRDPGADPNEVELRVHPTLVPREHPLASVNDVYNAIVIEGDPLGQVMFFGPGAGEGPTASAVVSDILNIVAALKTGGATQPAQTINPLLACPHDHYSKVRPMASLETRFYIRFLTRDELGVIGALGTCFGNQGVSLESVVQKDLRDGLAEIVVVTHTVREGNVNAALNEIRQLKALHSIASLLRVL
ncbi:homoserine dehydrogenase [Leptolyngbya sp. FACHB-261]|nr:homoserine dehydrogenase [Leptolyngbya sp. FACHB-261]